MSNTSFKSVKNVREPFSSLNATEGTIFGDYNRIFPKFIFSPFVDYANLKSIKLQTNGSSTTLRDSSGADWSPGKDVQIVAAELKTDEDGNNNPTLRVTSGDNIITNAPAASVQEDGARVFAVDDELGTAGKPSSIKLPANGTLEIDSLDTGKKAYVTIYYHE